MEPVSSVLSLTVASTKTQPLNIVTYKMRRKSPGRSSGTPPDINKVKFSPSTSPSTHEPLPLSAKQVLHDSTRDENSSDTDKWVRIVRDWFQGMRSTHASQTLLAPPNSQRKLTSCEKLLQIAQVFLSGNPHIYHRTNEEATSQVYRAIQLHPSKSQHNQWFLHRMPKGNIPHVHFDGLVPREEILNEAVKNNFWWDPENHCFSRIKKAGMVSASDLSSNPELLKKFYDMTTMRGVQDPKDAEEHFHNTFNRVTAVMKDFSLSKGLLAFTRESVLEGVQNAEVMIDRVPKVKKTFIPHSEKFVALAARLKTEEQSTNFDEKEFWKSDFGKELWLEFVAAVGTLERDTKWVSEYIEKTVTEIQSACAEVAAAEKFRAASILSNDSPFRVLFTLEVMRDIPYGTFFTHLVLAIKLHKQFPDIVGSITIDGHEQSGISREQWPLQRWMLDFLHKYFDKPNLNPHAGEWTRSTAKTAKRIMDCTDFSKRIGHGSGFATQTDSEDLAKILDEKDIPIEICSRSNAELIHRQSPINLYWLMGIRVVLGTDDPALWDKNKYGSLTDECIDAGEACGLTYKDQKEIQRASLHYSFLPGESIYRREGQAFVLKEEFADCYSTSWKPEGPIKDRLAKSSKAQRQVYFEQTCLAFEYDIHNGLQAGRIANQASQKLTPSIFSHRRSNS